MKIYKKDRRDLLPVYQKKTSNFYRKRVTSLGLSRLTERTAPAKVKFKVFLVHYGRHEYAQW